jgi:hypothetical protein
MKDIKTDGPDEVVVRERRTGRIGASRMRMRKFRTRLLLLNGQIKAAEAHCGFTDCFTYPVGMILVCTASKVRGNYDRFPYQLWLKRIG